MLYLFRFFFNDTATTEIYTLSYTLSLHDALPISIHPFVSLSKYASVLTQRGGWRSEEHTSELQSHSEISYAVFCLKKKKKQSFRHAQYSWLCAASGYPDRYESKNKISGIFHSFFFFNDTATTEIYTLSYTLSLHDALPISDSLCPAWPRYATPPNGRRRSEEHTSELQSHSEISYAVFCLKKKKIKSTKNPVLSLLDNNEKQKMIYTT